MAEGLPASARLVAAYRRLATSAKALHAASDDFAKPIEELDAALRQLSLGLETWISVARGSETGGDSWDRELGYARLSRKWGFAADQWGIVIRSTEYYEALADTERYEWPFNRAPRSYRIEALDKLPDLLDQLVKNADKTVKKLYEHTTVAHELANALKAAVKEVQAQPKERR